MTWAWISSSWSSSWAEQQHHCVLVIMMLLRKKAHTHYLYFYVYTYYIGGGGGRYHDFGKLRKRSWRYLKMNFLSFFSNLVRTQAEHNIFVWMDVQKRQILYLGKSLKTILLPFSSFSKRKKCPYITWPGLMRRLAFFRFGWAFSIATTTTTATFLILWEPRL